MCVPLPRPPAEPFPACGLSQPPPIALSPPDPHLARASSRLHLAPIPMYALSFRRTQPLPCPEPPQPDPPLHPCGLHRHRSPPSGPHTALHLIALPATRQGASSLSDKNKVLIRCAWEGVSVDGISVFDDPRSSGVGLYI